MPQAINWPDSIRPGIRRWAHEGYLDVSRDYTEVPLRTEQSENAYEEYQTSASANILQSTAKGESAPNNLAVEGDRERITNRKYTHNMEVHKEDIDRDRYNEIEDAARSGGESVAVTLNYWGFHPFRAGFDTSVSYGDGSPLFSTSHTRADGGASQSNASSTGMPFGYDNLDTATVALSQQLTEKGMPTVIGPNDVTLIVPTDLRKKALTVTRAEREPGTANNDINIFQGDVNVLVTKYVGSTMPARDDSTAGTATNWFLTTPEHSVMLQMEQEMMVEQDYNPRTQTATYTTSVRFGTGIRDWKGTWASKGDNASYSN